MVQAPKLSAALLNQLIKDMAGAAPAFNVVAQALPDLTAAQLMNIMAGRVTLKGDTVEGILFEDVK